MPPHFPSVPADDFRSFVNVVRRLREECPWDREQTHESIRNSLLEESYEVLETLDSGDRVELKKELGDLLLHVVMHATIAEQASEFTLQEVILEITSKLVRRHPHVFGSTKVADSAEVKQNWDRLKMGEGRSSILDGIPEVLPALQKAQRMQERAATAGFDWKSPADVLQKVTEEANEFRATIESQDPVKREEEFGDLLFSLVNYARFIKINAEDALRTAARKFNRRFRFVEDALRQRGQDIHASSLEEMDSLWNQAKSNGL